MRHKFSIGQKVVITSAGTQSASPRDASLEPYAGKVGTVSNFYWIGKVSENNVFCLYTVRIDPGRKEVVLYEDELQPSP